MAKCISGRGDHVQCFHCDGGLKNWDPEDDPFEEHARWFGDCIFLQLTKGPEYVRQVKQQKPQDKDYLDPEQEDSQLNLLPNGIAESSVTVTKTRSEKQVEQPSPPPASSFQEAQHEEELRKENLRLKEERLCKICVEREIGVVFIPCGHYATCTACASSFSRCPVCRAEIQSAVRTFIS